MKTSSEWSVDYLIENLPFQQTRIWLWLRGMISSLFSTKFYSRIFVFEFLSLCFVCFDWIHLLYFSSLGNFSPRKVFHKVTGCSGVKKTTYLGKLRGTTLVLDIGHIQTLLLINCDLRVVTQFSQLYFLNYKMEAAISTQYRCEHYERVL